jgi:hypothetical protein
MKENKRQPIVGASVPTGINAVKDFLQLKLGEMLLTTLPDDKKQALDVMNFCRENRVYVILSELMRRGAYERWRCPGLSKDDFDEITAAGGEFYLGRYVIGEAGGVLYWPKAYTINRRANSYENLRKCDSAESAHEEYIRYLTEFMTYEREKVGGGRLLNVESSMLFNYHAEAGIDAFIMEMFPGDPFRIMPAIRGNAKAFEKDWGCHIAMGWYGGIHVDDIWLKRWKLSLYYSYISGAGLIYPESGHYAHARETVFGFNHPKMKASRAVLREFWRFTKIHERPSDNPEVAVGVVFGNHEGCPGLWNPYAWGQYDNGSKWEAGPAEKGWELLEHFHRSENCFNETSMGARSFSGNPPMGQFDIVPVESDIQKLKQYQSLVFIGWNNMTEEIYGKLVEYVKMGGRLLMWLPHFNIEKTRNTGIRLFREGDLSELFGVEILGSLETDVIGVKYLRQSAVDSYKFPACGTRKDPSFIGRMTPAKIRILGKATHVLCGFSEYARETIEQLDERPALIENRLGKGCAWLVTAFEYPGDDGIKKFSENLLRVMLLGEQGELRLLCSDNVRYSMYNGIIGDKEFRLIYALNIGFDVSQAVRVWLAGNISEEIFVPPNGLKTIYVIGSVIVCPESKDSRICSITGEAGNLAIEFHSLERQFVHIFNQSATGMTISVNGFSVEMPPDGSGKIECLRKIDAGLSEFYEAGFLAEPDINVADTELPY